MATADGRVVIDCDLNDKGFSRGISGVEKKVKGLTAVVGKLGAAISAAFAVKAIIDFGKECVELGSNISEVQNVVDTAFGDMAYKVEAFSETAIQNFGMSRLAAKKTASTYMAMAKGMDLSDEAASNMALSLTGLTADVASFYNITQEAADVKLKSVFTGETESLKDLGVVMTQTNLKAYALSQGITKEISDMTQAEQVALRYGYVMKSLSLAQGDFAKTSDSWANQTRILSMQWQEFMSVIGQALITILTPLVKVLNQIVSVLIIAANAFNSFISSVFSDSTDQMEQTKTTANDVGDSISASVDNQEDLTKATEETAKAQKSLLAGFDEINQLGSDSASDKKGSTSGAVNIEIPEFEAKEITKSQLPSFFKKLYAAIKPIVDMVKWLFSYVKEGIALVKGAVTDTWQTIYPAIVEYCKMAASTVGSVFKEVKKIFDMIWRDAIAPALVIVAKIWSDMWTGIVDVWNTYGAPIFEKIRIAIQNVSSIFQNAWATILQPIWKTIISVVDELWTNHLKPLRDKITGFVAKLIAAALDIYNKFIAPVANWFIDTFGGTISGVISGIISEIGTILGVIATAAGYIVDALGGVLDFVVGVFTGDWSRAWEGVKNIFKGLWNGIVTILEGAVNLIIRGINWLISQLNKINFTIPDWVPAIGGKSVGINISAVREISIPRLATGAVIPPNREFMAVLGDQKHGNNIEAPEDLIRKIVREEAGGVTSDYLLREILDAIREGKVITVGKRQLGQVVSEALSSMSRSAGTSVLTTR